MSRNKRIAIIILSSILILCTVFVLLSVDTIVDTLMDVYRSLISVISENMTEPLPEGVSLESLLTPATLRKCLFLDVAILFITSLTTLYVAIMDRISERRTLLIVCLVIAILSCVDVVSLAIAIATFVVVLTTGDDAKSDTNSKSGNSSKSASKSHRSAKKPTIRKLED